jgi:Holliday junction resolvase RusA-like endonuclease
MKIQFFVPGDAKTSGSKRAFTNKKTGKLIVAPDNPKQKDWQAAVKWYAHKAANRMIPLKNACVLTCVFYRNRPKGHFRTVGGSTSYLVKRRFQNVKPGTKPDGLKLCRAVEDAMSGVIYADDALICDHHVSKRYCNNGQRPGVLITVETYDEESKEVTTGAVRDDVVAASLFSEPVA